MFYCDFNFGPNEFLVSVQIAEFSYFYNKSNTTVMV